MSELYDYKIDYLEEQEDRLCDSQNCDEYATHRCSSLRFHTYDIEEVTKVYCPRHTEDFEKKQAKRKLERLKQVEEFEGAQENKVL